MMLSEHTTGRRKCRRVITTEQILENYIAREAKWRSIIVEKMAIVLISDLNITSLRSVPCINYL
jgi:hypothetical protein